MAFFRFEELEIWKLGSDIGDNLFKIADMLSEKKKYRFSEQINGAAMSITNNIAEGSGSFSDKDFANFLNISRRSVFECANFLCILVRNRIAKFPVSFCTALLLLNNFCFAKLFRSSIYYKEGNIYL